MGYEEVHHELSELLELTESGATLDLGKLSDLFAVLVQQLIAEPLLFASREGDFADLRERVGRVTAGVRARTEFYQVLIRSLARA